MPNPSLQKAFRGFLYLKLACLVLLVGFGYGHAGGKDAVDPVTVDSGIKAVTIESKTIQPFKCDGMSSHAAVVVFITTDCPIANRYASEIEAIRAEYESRGVRMTLAHVDPDLSVKEAARHAEEYGLRARVVVDRGHQLVSAVKARITPEAFVIDANGRVRYRGRINDQFAGYGQRRAAPRTHDLRDALDAVLEGRAVKRPVTTPVGCVIPDAR